jgi:hypothetical protein
MNPLRPPLLLLLLLALARHTHGGDVRTRLRAQSPAPPPPRPSLDARLPHMCANHRTEFDMLARSQNQLVADMFFVALDTAIMPIGGTLLGSVRSRLLCSVWDDDVDFMVSSAEYDNLLHSRSLRTSSSAVEDVSETALGERLAADIRRSARCTIKTEGTPLQMCPKIVTLKILDPGPVDDDASTASVFFHEYFRRNPGELGRTCISLLFLKFGFIKILAHPQCNTGGPLDPSGMRLSTPNKIMDLFPMRFATRGYTCLDADIRRGVPGPHCVARALYAQPNVTASARMLTIEGDVELLVPSDYYAKPFLALHYGEDWETHAMICGHDSYTDYQACAAVEKPTPMADLRARMEKVAECQGLVASSSVDGDEQAPVAPAAVVLGSIPAVSELRKRIYLRVAKKSLKDRNMWTPIYYPTAAKMMLVNGKHTWVPTERARLLAPGLVSLANDETTAWSHPNKVFYRVAAMTEDVK